MWRTEFFRRWAAARDGKYSCLFACIAARRDYEWRTTFREIEEILGFDLPPSARHHQPWWANEKPGGSHTQALAWTVAGWKTAEVDMEAETLVFRRPRPERKERGRVNLDEEFPVFHTKLLRKDATFSREEIYDDRI